MQFAKELIGGVLIIIAAGFIGIAQNAVRDDSVSLVPSASRGLATRDAQSQPVAEKEVANQPDPPATVADAMPGGPTSAELSSGELDMNRVRSLLETGDIVLVDARSGAEYEAGHITGAVNIPYDELLDYYDQLKSTIPADAVVVCYCESVTCDQSENLAKELAFMGYTNVLVYKGGWQEWETAGYPVERSSED
ncbi:MAG: rhodanese-like domain-containing protein [Candidatus Latescibacterota bacterium]|nr:MAG: rhodanese-like domain-containing protein [Candidatus Latescibacterota bacterium]